MGFSSKWNAYMLFILWPFLSVIYAIVNYRSKWAKNIIWFFCCFFGYTFVISNEGMDANRYRDFLVELHTSEISFGDYFHGVYNGDIGRGDYLEPTIRYIVSRFSDDYRILYAIFGFIMGYFYSRNIWFLLDEVSDRIKPYAIPFLVMLYSWYLFG
jgi:hypothetical protein